MKRSLLLAGGGMRVAYQAGVLRALDEAGIRFAHVDGTSGGTINLAMLLSGLTPEEMCERWRTLDVHGFVSFLRLRQYVQSLQWPAFGGADGLRKRVFPHLGIDVERIRAARGIEGTFNVCNYTDKTNRATPHEQIDLDLLVAGVSLPMVMPPVEHDGSLYLDSVWIKDANPTEAVRRGSEELWLVWCIGNHGVYRSGAFNQYVHMIELSANGKLFEELAQLHAANPALRLHVIKPAYPLPLDPDFYLGRIDASALVAAGYRDACAYLDALPADGVPWTPAATRMRDPRVGGAFVHRFGDVDLRVDVRDLDTFEADVVGRVGDALARSGSVALAGGRLRYELALSDGRRLEAEAPPWGTADVRLLEGDRVVEERRVRGRVSKLQSSGTDSLRKRVGAFMRLARLLFTRRDSPASPAGRPGTAP